MKQKDITLILVIVVLSGAGSLLLSSLVLGSPQKRQAEVEVVDNIVAEFRTPDSKYFNNNSIDPTKLIKIGDSPNANPFNDKN